MPKHISDRKITVELVALTPPIAFRSCPWSHVTRFESTTYDAFSAICPWPNRFVAFYFFIVLWLPNSKCHSGEQPKFSASTTVSTAYERFSVRRTTCTCLDRSSVFVLTGSVSGHLGES